MRLTLYAEARPEVPDDPHVVALDGKRWVALVTDLVQADASQ